MAKFKITPTTVAELKEQFRNEIGGVLRVYEGRSQAPADATLVSLGAKEGELECRTSRTVGKFEEAFLKDLNLKVKVYTKDENVSVLDGITLATVKEIPNMSTHAKMEKYLSYKREEKDEEIAEVASEQITASVEVPEEYKGLPIIEITTKEIDMNNVEAEGFTEYPIVGSVFVGGDGDDFEGQAIVADTFSEFLESANYYIRKFKSDFGDDKDVPVEVKASTKIKGYGQAEDIEEVGDVIGAAINALYGHSSLFGAFFCPDWFAKKAIFVIDGYMFTSMSDEYDVVEINLSKEQLDTLKAILVDENFKSIKGLPIIEINTREIDINNSNPEGFVEHPTAGVVFFNVEGVGTKACSIVCDTLKEFCESANKTIHFIKDYDLTQEEAEKATVKVIASTMIKGYGQAEDVKKLTDVIGCAFDAYYVKDSNDYFDYTWPDWFSQKAIFIVEGNIFSVDKDVLIKMRHHLSDEQLKALKAAL